MAVLSKLPLPALMLLGACVTPPVSPTAVPGPSPAAPSDAGQIFARACIETQPQFAGLPAAISNYPMTQNASTGTYFHDEQDLSVKRLGRGSEGYCSIVFGSDQPIDQTVITFGGAVSATLPDAEATVTLSNAGVRNGRTYLNARIDAQ